MHFGHGTPSDDIPEDGPDPFPGARHFANQNALERNRQVKPPVVNPLATRRSVFCIFPTPVQPALALYSGLT